MPFQFLPTTNIAYQYKEGKGSPQKVRKIATQNHSQINEKKERLGLLNTSLKITKTRDEFSTPAIRIKVLSRCLSGRDATSLHHCFKNKQLNLISVVRIQHCKKWGVMEHLCHGVLGHFHICWGVTVHLCHGVLGHFHIYWCNVTLQVVLVHNGVFYNTLKKCSKGVGIGNIVLEYH